MKYNKSNSNTQKVFQTNKLIPISNDAYYGIAGEIVNKVLPKTEADPVALLIQLLVCLGNLFGRSPYIQVGASKHHLNLYAILVGKSATGRKGTSLEVITDIIKEVDPEWWFNRRISGLGSGEGLVSFLKDNQESDFSKSLNELSTNDKRALILEGEYSSILKVASREGNTLSPNLRNGFDSGDLSSITKHQTLKARNTHISMVAHITKQELERFYRNSTDLFNGTANRNIWIITSRSKLLPFPEPLDKESRSHFINELTLISNFAKYAQEIKMSESTKIEYEILYKELSSEKPGILGTLSARSAPFVLRLSSIYALLDKTTVIEPQHLKAAKAIWNYSERSIRYIFGDSTGNKHADQILTALRFEPSGLSQSELHVKVFNKNINKSSLEYALNILLEGSLIESNQHTTPEGKIKTMWQALTKYEFNELTQ